MKKLKEIFKKVRKFFSKLLRKKPHKKKSPWLRITVMVLLFVAIIPLHAQRATVPYIYVYFHQEDLSNVDYWTVRWLGVDSDSAVVDTNQAFVYNPQSQLWVTYFEGADSIRLQVNSTFQFDEEYTVDVRAHNIQGDSLSLPAQCYFIVSDVNLDNSVDGLDLIQLSLNWARTGLTYRDFVDINGDTYTDGLDLIQMSLDWGQAWIP
jgi:hypothetical protein